MVLSARDTCGRGGEEGICADVEPRPYRVVCPTLWRMGARSPLLLLLLYVSLRSAACATSTTTSSPSVSLPPCLFPLTHTRTHTSRFPPPPFPSICPQVILPKDLASQCCGMMFNSRGLGEAAALKGSQLEDALMEASQVCVWGGGYAVCMGGLSGWWYVWGLWGGVWGCGVGVEGSRGLGGDM